MNASYLKWQAVVAIASCIAISLHLGMKWAELAPQTSIVPLFIIIILGGIPLIVATLLKLAKANLGADILAVIAIITAAMLQEYLAATLVILMLSSGQALEAYAMRRASSVLSALADRMPAKAHRKRDTHIEDIDLKDIVIGDAIVIYPHETCPVDGIVIEGHGSMDESYLTGEPYRIAKVSGVAVLSGAINGEDVLVVEATKLPSDSRYAQIMQVMEEAEQKRPQLRRLGDKIGALFAPLALTIALAAWYATGEPVRFLSVLVIATPCPLLIAIPITIISAISMAARRGIVIKDPTVLEYLPTCRTAIFDKTGTLTYGKPQLTEILCNEGVAAEMILQQAASLERYSKHPLASAVLEEAKQRKLYLLEASHVSEKPGQGLKGKVDGHDITVTHRRQLLKSHPELAALLPATAAGLECVLLTDGQYTATFRFRDKPRAEGKSFIGHLAPIHHFKHVMMLSGDRASEVEYLASELGIKEMYASQSPEQKLALVRAEVAKAPTLYMGDGINDAPALAAATVGIACGQYSSATAESAGAVIMDNTLIKVDELLHISARMRSIALQSAIGGMVLSLIGMGFACTGIISPVLGAILQECVDVLAILNALRLTWQPRLEVDIKG